MGHFLVRHPPRRHRLDRAPSLGGWLLRLEWTHGNLAFTTAEAPDWRIVLMPTHVPDLFTITDGGNLPSGNVTFKRLADGRVASVHLMDSTWVRCQHSG